MAKGYVTGLGWEGSNWDLWLNEKSSADLLSCVSKTEKKRSLH